MSRDQPTNGVVEARSLALFGKRDASGDYEWLRGRDAIPPSLYDACEQIARISNETGVVLALVMDVEGRTFLVRTYRQGIDSAYRPILALEVAALDDGAAVTRADWVGLAGASLQAASQEVAGSGRPISLEIPTAQETEPDPEALDRVRLGVPVSVNVPVARNLLRRFPRRFPGLVLAPKLKDGATVPWKPFLAPYLAVNFGPPPLRDDEEEALRAIRERRPDADEWERLAAVDAGRVRQALSWALQPAGRPPLLAAEDDPLLPWLIGFRGERLSGADLLRTLRADLDGAPLPVSVWADAFPTLSPDARDAILAAEGDNWDGIGVATLEDLARHGLLDDGKLFPLKRWAPAARGSEVLAARALSVLHSRGVEDAVARLALGLPVDEPLSLQQVERAAEIAQGLELPLSLTALRDVLAQPSSPQHLEAAERIGPAIGAEGVRLARIARHGTLPEERTVEPADLVLALQARSRALPEMSLLPILSDLCKLGWTDEGRAVLAAEAEGKLPLLSPEARGVARARLDGGSPVPVTAAETLRPLVWAGLARPEDVIPPADATALAAAAALWPQTLPLAGILRGQGPVPAMETCPTAWLPSLRQALRPEMVAQWLSRLAPGERPAGRSWICSALGLPAAIAQLFDGGLSPGDDAEVLRDHLSWIALFARAGGSEERQDLLVGLIQARIAEGDDRFADRIAAELFPGAGEELHDLMVHLLSGVGPLPPFANTSPELLSRLVPLMPALPLVNALFLSREGSLTRSPALIEAVVARVKEAAVACPDQGYTVFQIHRHAGLARRLSELADWERVTLDPEVLKRIGRREVRRLGLPVPESWDAPVQETETASVAEAPAMDSAAAEGEEGA